MPRVAGNRGRLPARPPAERLPIGWVHSYLAQPLPAAAYPVDVTGGIPAEGWEMLANGPDPTCSAYPRGLGDCSFAARVHNEMAKAAAGGEPLPSETSNQLVAEYLQYTGGQDTGAVLADLLLYWYRAGRILAFAPVDHTDPDSVDSAMQAFHGAYVGVDLTADADDLFQQGEPWTVAHGEQADPSLGHCIVKVQASGLGMDGYVTWGALQPATALWSRACLREAWVIVTQQDADAARLDVAALRADIDALGGTGGDTASAPIPAHHAIALADLATDVERAIAAVRSYLSRHGL